MSRKQWGHGYRKGYKDAEFVAAYRGAEEALEEAVKKHEAYSKGYEKGYEDAFKQFKAFDGATAPHCDTGAFFVRACPFNGGLCEAPSRVAGTVAGSSEPRTVRHHLLRNFDAGGLQTFNGDASCL